MSSLSLIQDAHNKYQDSLLASFEDHLRKMVARAQSNVLAKLTKQLSMTDGKIDQTPANIKALRNLNNLFMDEMDKEGLDPLMRAFVGEFNGQIHYLDETLQYLSDQMDEPLPGIDLPLKLTAGDAAVLSSLQANTISAIETAIESAAGSAMTRGMFTVGGLEFGQLVKTIGEKFDQSIGQATTVAETAQSVFYRTAADRVFKKVEKDAPGELRYEYSGPRDKLNRLFCAHMMQMDKSYARAEIDKMNNGQTGIGTVFLFCGGYRCRHNLILSTRELEASIKAAA
jgi:hypothetical protein